MNNKSNHPELETVVPADVAEIAAMLDALGAAERASMPGGMAEGISAVSYAALLYPESADAVTETSVVAASAEAEREHVPAGLEDRVFEASRRELVGAKPGLRLAGEGTLPPRRVVKLVWWQRSAMRVAAAVAIIGAGATAFVVLRGDEQAAVEPDVSVIAASFDSEMERFFDLLESTPSTTASESSLGDHSITDALLEWESL